MGNTIELVLAVAVFATLVFQVLIYRRLGSVHRILTRSTEVTVKLDGKVIATGLADSLDDVLRVSSAPIRINTGHAL